MKNIAISLIVFITLVSCKSGDSRSDNGFKSVSVDTVFNDKISIRALVLDKNKVWYAADKSRFGYYDLKTLIHVQKTIAGTDEKLEFRSIGQNSKSIFMANIGSPACIYKIDKANLSYQKVYSETNEKAFYDSMAFWNEKEGIAVGDPIDNCLSILITRDGGKTWKKSACENSPPIVDGEAVFAASNTNICINGNATWIVSGGRKARVFFSPDKGKTWQASETPIVQGQAMTGIFTADFYDAKIGIVAGGDYENPNQDSKNKAMTSDGGKTWKLIADKSGFGYTSCIQFVPKSKGKQLVAVGLTGLYYSADGGSKWKQFSTDKSLYTIRFLDENTAFAAGKDKIIRIEFKK